MRRLVLLLLATAPLLSVGCNWFGLRGDDQTGKLTGKGRLDKIQPRPATEFVGYLNRQAGYLQTVRYDDVNLSVSVPNQWVPGLGNGMLVCGKPNNFRMNAKGPVGGTQLDVGSNASEMWMYVKPSDPQFLYCSHTEFPRVQSALPVKFEPAWVLQALGMAEYPADRDYTVQLDEARRVYYLQYPDTTADGKAVRKVTEFAADTVGGSVPQVRRHFVMTADGKKLIARAEVKKTSEQVLTDARGGSVAVQVPTEVTLEWPQEQVKMDLTLGKIKVNEPMTQDTYDALFRRPKEIGSARPVNMADYLSSPRSGGGVSRGSRPDDALPRR